MSLKETPNGPRDKLHVLLAEDIPVNQKFAVALLERHGHEATVAANGLLALKAWEQGGFDLILMDMMMPGMDGLEATRLIRQSERQQGRPRIPIVAITANNMPSDRARCLEAGMDGYVSKPFRPEILYQEIKRVLSLREAPFPARPDDRTKEDVVPIFDREEALSRIAGDEELLATLIAMFRADANGYVREIESALESQDVPRTIRAAHTLKSVLATFSAFRAEARARELEHLAKSGDSATCRALLPAARSEIETFLQAID